MKKYILSLLLLLSALSFGYKYVGEDGQNANPEAFREMLDVASLYQPLSANLTAWAGKDVTASAAELNFVDGVMSSIQDQLDNKQPLIGVGQLALNKLSQSGATTNQVATWNGSSWAPATASGGNLTSGPVTSSGGVSAIADGALSIAKTSGLQTALDARRNKTTERIFMPEDYGALGNAKEIKGVRTITSGQATLTVTGAGFVGGDVGKIIIIPGAAAAGGVLYTTISVYTSATQVTIAANAGSTLSSSSGRIYTGTNDDTAVQAAITAAQALPGGTVLLSNAYMLSSGVTVAKAWLTMRGYNGGSYYDDGYHKCGFLPGTASTVCIKINGPSGKSARGLVFENFTIAGLIDNYLTTTTKGFEAYPGGSGALYPDGLIIRNVNVQWMGTGIELSACDSPRIQQSRICDNNRGLLIDGCIGANVTGNYIWDNSSYGLKLSSGVNYNAVISGNQFGRSAWDIDIASAEGFTISANAFHGGPPSPVATQYGAIRVTSNSETYGGTISGNNFHAITWPVSTQGWQTAAILLATATNVAVTGNNFTFPATTLPAISITSGTGCAVIGNNFSIATKIPVTTDSASRMTRISGNEHAGTITNSGTTLPVIASWSSNEAANIISTIQSYGVTLSAPQQTLISDFVTAEKAASRWTGLKAFHMTGFGNANANALNWKTGKAGNFYGTVTHSTGFSYGDGSTGFFDFGQSGSSFSLTTTDHCLGALVYLKHSVAAYSALISQIGNTATDMQLLDSGSNVEWYAPGTGSAQTRTDTGGIFLGTRSGTTSKAHRRLTSGFTSSTGGTVAAGAGLSTTNLYAWRRGTTSPDLYSNARVGCLFVSAAMDDSNASAFTANLKTLWEGLFGLTLP